MPLHARRNQSTALRPTGALKFMSSFAKAQTYQFKACISITWSSIHDRFYLESISSMLLYRCTCCIYVTQSNQPAVVSTSHVLLSLNLAATAAGISRLRTCVAAFLRVARVSTTACTIYHTDQAHLVPNHRIWWLIEPSHEHMSTARLAQSSPSPIFIGSSI